MPSYLDIIQHTQRIKQIDVLICPGNAPAVNLIGLQPLNTPILEQDIPAGQGMDTADQVKQGGLTGAVGTYQAKDGAVLHFK